MCLGSFASLSDRKLEIVWECVFMSCVCLRREGVRKGFGMCVCVLVRVLVTGSGI